MIEFFKYAAGAGMLASFVFAYWPVWFLDRTDRSHPYWRILFKLLATLGLFGWMAFFRAGIQASLHIEGGALATCMAVGLLAVIYLSACRAEALAYREKLRLQAERNARKDC
jgi:hypothetical protein